MAQQQKRSASQPFEDKTPPRVYIDYDLPEELWPDSKTADFGEIRTLVMKLLTPLEEKAAVQRARGDNLRMAYELAEAAIAGVINAEGQESRVASHDGTVNLLVSQMHPKIRSLVMRAYSEDSVPTNKAEAGFIKSRRIRV